MHPPSGASRLDALLEDGDNDTDATTARGVLGVLLTSFWDSLISAPFFGGWLIASLFDETRHDPVRPTDN